MEKNKRYYFSGYYSVEHCRKRIIFIIPCCLSRIVNSERFQNIPYVWGVCVTNNNGFWIACLDLLTLPLELQLIITAHYQWLPKTCPIPYWTTSVFTSTVIDLVLTYASPSWLPLPAGQHSTGVGTITRDENCEKFLSYFQLALH
jgi:hypothetical protein